jgi:hypothetical protein
LQLPHNISYGHTLLKTQRCIHKTNAANVVIINVVVVVDDDDDDDDV